MGTNRPITVGRIDYANVWPIFHYAEQQLPEDRFRIEKRVPAALNRALRQGEIDITSMSSFAYAENADNYLVLPDLSVSAKGRVNSILLFMKKPLDQVLRGRIAMTTTSATSVNLLKILMKLYYQAEPSYVTMEPSLDDMLAEADAALLIGDTAIHASWANRHKGLAVIDLGELWRSWTGYGMTFALVAVRREVAERDPEAVSDVLHALTESKERSLRDLNPLIAKACAQLGGEPSYWHRYFHELHYNFGSDEQAGLSLYFDYAHQLGLLPHEVHMRFFEDHAALKVKNE
ncbi:menaquinone biosynthesis protein [Paenibacillus sacheonensis]|uniref:Chorismate dehydratase n=1 Tax=Paenibacillus sacheonensis TaxID=742054 RepID=A0A7X5C144_9BACL|nr:menaquinone biosynthesis protein [Paenibacillus sacheonensis]MBM7564489.1 chorismate dehydratase [Paenibacillus sacheonensis]NBC69049.1 ABC transporter substrate-binding protein [Paenibacillus sacheonensis]